MKSIFKYISLLAVAATLLLTATSCEEFLDVNVDPNNPTEVSPDLVLPTAMQYTARYIGEDRYLNHLGNMFMYNWSQSDGFSWYEDEFLYDVNSSFYIQLFNFAYSNALKQYQILDQPEDSTMANYAAIAKIMKSYHFQILVDLYGDIPYTEALLRKDGATPAYDAAEDVYVDLVAQLDEAVDLIENASPVALEPGIDDIVFGGNMDDWVALANTIKLRIMVRAQDAGLFDATDWSTLEGATFIASNVGINPGYVVDDEKQNPFWNELGWDVSGAPTLSNQATCATQFVLDYLTATSDPRIDYIYELPATGHLGVVQGLLDYDTPVPDAFTEDKVSNIGPGILKSASMDMVMFSLAESYLLQAEAVNAGLLTGDAGALYAAGVTASFNYLGAPGAAGYLAQTAPNTGWPAGTTEENLEAIITQKWVCLNGISAEQTWFDYSRTGYPTGQPVVATGFPISERASTSDRPVRLLYPSGEISANPENVPAQTGDMAFNSKIFWAE